MRQSDSKRVSRDQYDAVLFDLDGVRAGENANAFRGGFRLWAGADVLPPAPTPGRLRSRQRSNH
jgi:hypothetical protein